MLLLTIPASAEIYKWTDEKRQVYFSDKKPENYETVAVAIEAGSYKNVSFEPATFDAGQQVILLSADWCEVCKKAKSYFRRNGIPFPALDIENNSRGKQLYEQLGAKAVPLILVGKKRMNGFTEKGFERIYK